jgi:autotransporter-associated beta strand protein
VGKWTLTGASTYTGGTTVSNGTLVVNNSTGSGTGSGNVAVRNGATLGGSGTINGATTIESGATLAPGDAIGTLTFGGALTIQSGANISFQLGTSSDRVNVTGALTISGTINISAAAGFGVGTYTLFSSSGGLTIGTLTLGSLPAGFNYALDTATPGQIKLIVSPTTPPAFSAINLTGGNLVLSGTNGSPGATYQVLSSTNLALPLANWVPVVTNLFDSNGNFGWTNTPDAGVPQTFYRLFVP